MGCPGARIGPEARAVSDLRVPTEGERRDARASPVGLRTSFPAGWLRGLGSSRVACGLELSPSPSKTR